MRLFLQPNVQTILMANTFVSKLARKYLKLLENFMWIQKAPQKLRGFWSFISSWLLIHSGEEIIVVLGVFQLVDQEFNRIDGTHR